MKRLYLLLLCFGITLLHAQEGAPEYRSFPIVISIQFHSLSLPFQRIKSNFSNVGIGIGTEVSYGGKDRVLQQFQLAWYRNKAVGNGLLFYSQTAWRPTSSHIYGEIKLGAGYHYAFRPTTSFRQTETGWQSVGRKGKGMLTIPIGASLGYDRPSFNTHVSPFIGYQCLAMIGYNKSIPLLPETLLQVGSRIHLEK